MPPIGSEVQPLQQSHSDFPPLTLMNGTSPAPCLSRGTPPSVLTSVPRRRPSPVTNDHGERGGTLGGETPGEGVRGGRPSAQIESTLAANVPSKFTS